MPLSALSSEVLEHIAWFLFKDGTSNLLFTGDRTLRTKMLRFRRVTISWQNAVFCDWSACYAHLASFSNLRELSLCTPSSKHFCTPLLKVVDLPSNLVSLDLRFRGVMGLLTALVPGTRDYVGHWKRFTQLRTLYLQQDFVEANLAQGSPTQAHIAFFPSSLEHLHLRADAREFCVYSSDLRLLPKGLKTFDVSIRLVYYEPTLDALRPFGAPNASIHFPSNAGSADPPSLTFLSLDSLSHPVDISAIAPSLKHLSIPQHGVTWGPGYPARFVPANPTDPSSQPPHYMLLGPGDGLTPYRTLLPRLETLILPSEVRIKWSLFETFPTSLTRLRALFEHEEDHQFHYAAECNALNEHYRRASKDDASCPAAPAMLRSFYFPPELGNPIAQCLPYFSSLVTTYINATGPLDPKLWPRSLTGATVSSLESFHGYPRNLSELVCFSSKIDLQSEHSRLLEASAIPRLSVLNVMHSPLTLGLVSILPSSLESLNVKVDATDVLEALTIKANFDGALPRLTSLTVATTIDSNFQHAHISLATVPQSLTSLTIRGLYSFPPSHSNESLRHHINMTSFSYSTHGYDVPHTYPTDLMHYVPHFPRINLRHLSFTLSAPFDLNRPEHIALLEDLPPHLHTLHIIPYHGQKMPMFEVLRKHAITPTMKKRLLDAHKGHFGLSRLLPISWYTDTRIYFLCENLIFSCLPRSLRELRFDVYSGINNRYDNIFQSLLELRLNRPTDWLKRMLFVRVPIIGMFLNPVNTPAQPLFAMKEDKRARFEAAPPNISFWEVDSGNEFAFRNPQRILSDPTYDMPLYRYNKTHATERTYRYRFAFHLFNVLLWSTLGNIFPIARHSHPIAWALKWNNILGSALFLPLLLYRQQRAPATPIRNAAQLSSRVFAFTMTVALPWTLLSFGTGAAGFIALGVTSSSWSPWYRVPAFLWAALGEFFIHAAAHEIW